MISRKFDLFSSSTCALIYVCGMCICSFLCLGLSVENLNTFAIDYHNYFMMLSKVFYLKLFLSLLLSLVYLLIPSRTHVTSLDFYYTLLPLRLYLLPCPISRLTSSVSLTSSCPNPKPIHNIICPYLNFTYHVLKTRTTKKNGTNRIDEQYPNKKLFSIHILQL